MVGSIQDTPRSLGALAVASRVLIGFDVDANGRGDDAAAWWLRTLPHATRLRPWVHDVNEMFQQQQDIRTWVALGLEMPIQTVAIEPLEQKPDENIDRTPLQALEQQPDENIDRTSEEMLEEEPSLFCSICGAEVECYSSKGIAYCMQHWSKCDATERPTLLTPAQEIMELVRQWDEGHPAQMVIDLETTGLDPRQNKVVTIAFGVPGKVSIIDMRSYYRTDPAHQQAWREALQHLLHRDVLWIGHHVKFDWSFLAQQFGVQLERVYDTMLVEKLLHAGGHVLASLQASAKRYNIVVTKEQRSWFIDLDKRPSEWAAPLPDAQLAYIRQDIDVPSQLYERQQEAIATHELARAVTVEHQALPAIAAMEIHGVCIDVARWRDILATRIKQKEDLEAQIQQILGNALAGTQPEQGTLFGERRLPIIHLTSSVQLMQALRALGVCVTSTSKEALYDVQHQHTVIPLLLK